MGKVGFPHQVSAKERIDTYSFWRRHAENLREHNLVSDDAITWVMICTKRECIGFDSSKGEIIRPGGIGKWDMYDMALQGRFSDQECLLMADITPSEFAAEERRESIRDSGFDPDDPDEVRRHERLYSMTPGELNAEIARLKKLLSVS